MRRTTSSRSPYLIATSEVGDDPRLLELMLDHGAKVDERTPTTDRPHPRRRTSLPAHRSRLLEAGIDRDHMNRLGWTALHEAIVLGQGVRSHVTRVRALIEGGVDVNIPDGDGVRPLALAEEPGYTEIVDLLREADARR